MVISKYIEERLSDFLEKKGIKPEKIDSSHTVRTIGFSEKEQKWYGWSHRAICGFKVGDTIKNDNHVCAETLKVGFKAKNLDDCKKMAIAFARGVS